MDTDFLVVGSGPAGAALGAFLGQNGKMEHVKDMNIVFQSNFH